MILKINCKHNNKGAWCTNKNIKRSLFGLGARCCIEHNDGVCELKEKFKKGAPPPLIRRSKLVLLTTPLTYKLVQ